MTDPGQWVDQHGDVLYRYALSRLRDPESAEEVVQETFVAALEARDQFAGKGTEGAWLLGILKRKIIDYLRRRSRGDAGTGAADDDDISERLFDRRGNWRSDVRLAGGSPSAALEKREFWDVFRRCLDQLPRRQADVFTLREIEELASENICKELAISASNLWVLLYRARLRLSGCMKSRLENGGDR